MKIEKLSMTNFQIVSALDVEFTTPVHLFAGDNEQGKSSIAEAVSYALLGRPTRVSDKKSDIKTLVRDGAKTGSVELTADGVTNVISLPKGEIVDAINSRDMEMLPYVLDPSLFARQDDAKRRALLFKLTGISVNAVKIRERLLRRKCNADKIEIALPMLKAGFDSACAEAKAKQSEARGSWKAVANDTYGSVKAENWQAEKPEFDADAIEDAQEQIDALTAEIDSGNQQLGALSATHQAYLSHQARHAALTEQASQLGAAASKLANAQQEYDDLAAQVESLRQKTGQKPASAPLACPHCGGMVNHENGRLVEHVSQAYDAEAAAKLPEFERGLTVLANALATAKRQHEAAQIAASTLSNLGTHEPVEQSEIDAIKNGIEESMTLRGELLKSLRAQEALRDAAMSADDRTAKAAQHHNDVAEWGAIAEAFAPDGIPSELLADALKPVNERLQKTAMTTGWKQVMIRADMSILVDGRNHGLMSESAKWRADASIAEAISFISGTQLLMLDRIDVLAPANRPALLLWLDGLATAGDISNAIIFGTFKSKPAGLPETIGVSWIENGEIIA